MMQQESSARMTTRRRFTPCPGACSHATGVRHRHPAATGAPRGAAQARPRRYVGAALRIVDPGSLERPLGRDELIREAGQPGGGSTSTDQRECREPARHEGGHGRPPATDLTDKGGNRSECSAGECRARTTKQPLERPLSSPHGCPLLGCVLLARCPALHPARPSVRAARDFHESDACDLLTLLVPACQEPTSNYPGPAILFSSICNEVRTPSPKLILHNLPWAIALPCRSSHPPGGWQDARPLDR